MKSPIYDLIIIGAGPAGLTASIYASRYKLNNLVIGKQLGGELALASKVENYPGFISIPGLELCQKTAEQVEKLGAKILYKEVGRIEKSGDGEAKFKIDINKEEVYEARALIVATGSERRRLNIPGEKEYTGKGISYCTTCDAPFYRDRIVALIGGADSAVSGAIHTAEYAKKVYIIYRKDRLRAEPIWLEEWKKIEDSGKGEVIYNTNITRILGSKEFAKNSGQNPKPEEGDKVIAVELDKAHDGKNILEVDGVFIEIGGVPGTSLVQSLGLELTESGHVKVSENLETSLVGLYCAGDMTNKSAVMQQAITAMAQGAIAAASVYKFLKGQQAPRILGV